jgi:hypothetical protein
MHSSATSVAVQTSTPRLSIVSQDVGRLDRPNYVLVSVTAHIHGQIPADQSAWLVEAIGPIDRGRITYHPKRLLNCLSPCHFCVSEEYLSSGNPQLQRRPMVLIVSKFLEPQFWATLQEGRRNGSYKPLFLDTSPGQILALGDVYSTSPQVS